MVLKIATEHLIALRGVSKSYQQPNGQQIVILENINLELRSGEIVALLGPSGSGKSTLMRTIAGLIAPTEGQVLYHDTPLVGLNPGVAIVFQSFALYPWLTVLENVELGLKAKGEPADPRRQKALKMICSPHGKQDGSVATCPVNRRHSRRGLTEISQSILPRKTQ